MKKDDIIKNLKKLKLNKKDYIVICGSSLVMQGIIDETPDIDLACSKEIYDILDWKYQFRFLDYYYYNNFDILNNFYIFCHHLLN